MSIEADFVTHAMAQSSLTDLIGTRLYPLNIPQDVSLPAIGFRKVSDIGQQRHDKAIGESKIRDARIQLNIIGESLSQVKAIRDVIVALFDGYAGTWDSTSIHECRVEEMGDDWQDTFERRTSLFDLVLMYTG